MDHVYIAILENSNDIGDIIGVYSCNTIKEAYEMASKEFSGQDAVDVKNGNGVYIFKVKVEYKTKLIENNIPNFIKQ